MAKQKIAQNWKIVETHFDASTNNFYEVVTKIGHFTQATANEKFLAKFPGWKFRNVSSRGSGGYLVDQDGTTAELLPSFD